ncbi:hypothetical protein C8Q74DRAFT_263489 [Fomes fomentarius]|nr:hypothetical protein C8Q74DRAFT_263489 [Fomes fomentarius]
MDGHNSVSYVTDLSIEYKLPVATSELARAQEHSAMVPLAGTGNHARCACYAHSCRAAVPSSLMSHKLPRNSVNAHPIKTPCSVSSSRTSAHSKLIISPAEPQSIPLPARARQEQGYPAVECLHLKAVSRVFLTSSGTLKRSRGPETASSCSYCAAVRAGPSWLPFLPLSTRRAIGTRVARSHRNRSRLRLTTGRSLQVLYGRERASSLRSWDSFPPTLRTQAGIEERGGRVSPAVSVS